MNLIAFLRLKISALSETKKASKQPERGQFAGRRGLRRRHGFRSFGVPPSGGARPRKAELQTKAPSPLRSAGALQNSIRKPMLLAITMQQLFEKAFITESCHIVCRSQLEKKRHGYTPGHPLIRIIIEVQTPPDITFHH